MMEWNWIDGERGFRHRLARGTHQYLLLRSYPCYDDDGVLSYGWYATGGHREEGFDTQEDAEEAAVAWAMTQ